MVIDHIRTVPDHQWTWDRYTDYQDILRKAKEYDERTGQPDCHALDKDAVLKRILEVLEKVERKL